MTRLFKLCCRYMLAVFAALLLNTLITLPASAQTVTGTITGTVTDPSGAVVSGADVTAHAIDTGVDATAKTNDSGSYRIQFLPTGRYQISAAAPGFDTEKLPVFTLEVLQSPTVNIKMQVGSSSTSIDVQGASPILDTNDPTLSTTFSANAITNFPLNGLDFSAITLYVPGAVSTGGTSGFTSFERSTYNTDTINLNGNRAQANNYTLEGIDMNETFNNLISYSPAPEALGEIKVLTANSPIDYGNVNGAGVVSVLKSGTNSFHGSAYGYVQDYRFNANSFQNNHVLPPDLPTPINPFSQAQFGGTLGGPIKRDKLFFFVDYLASRYHVGGIGKTSVFTQAMRNGDFSALLAQPTPIQLYDPLNGFAPYVGDKGIAVTNPVAQFLFANPTLYPLPNLTPTDGLAANDYEAPQRSFKANNQGDIKIEYHARAKDLITGFYSMSTAYDGTTPILAITFAGVNLYPTKLLGANWVHTFSPSLINSARIGFTRTVWATSVSVDSTGLFGTSGDAKVGIPFPNQAFEGFSYQGVGGGIFAGGNNVQGGGLIDNTYSYIDNATWTHGKNLFSFGVQALRYQNNYPTANNYGYLGTLTYSGAFTSNPLNTASGYGGADFLLDRVSAAQVTLASVNVGQRQWRTAGFVGDDIKATPKLTFNVGVRYEIDEPWVESNNKTGNVDEVTGQVLYAGHVPDGAPVGSGVCSNRGCYDYNYRQIMPRLGFAYQAANRFVVRGGYGTTSFYEGNSSNQRLTSITPFIQAINAVVNPPTQKIPTTPRTAEEGFTGNISSGGTYNVYPKNIQPAYVQNWNLTLEYALSNTMSLQVGYLGEQGQHIEDYGNLNQWKVAGDPTSAPFYNSPYIGVNTDPSTSVGSGNLLVTESRAMMNYNALQAVLRERLSHGLEFTLNYSYGKAMTNSLGNYSLNVNGYSGAFQNYYDSSADYGPAGYDVTHNVSFTGVYALPVGRGRQYLSGVNRVIDEVIGGWKISTAGVIYSGFPQTVTGGDNETNSFGNMRPNQYRRLIIKNRSLDHWFGTDPSVVPCQLDENGNPTDNGVCAYGAAAPGQFGTTRNGTVRGPGYENIDMSAFKDFRIFHEHTVGFRFDAFNAFNIVSYGNPDAGAFDSTFGRVIDANNSSIRSVERHLQFSAHYNF